MDLEKFDMTFDDNTRIISLNEYETLLFKSIDGKPLTELELRRMHEYERYVDEQNRKFDKNGGSSYKLKSNNYYGSEIDEVKEEAGAVSAIIIVLTVLCIGLFLAFLVLGFIS